MKAAGLSLILGCFYVDDTAALSWQQTVRNRIGEISYKSLKSVDPYNKSRYYMLHRLRKEKSLNQIQGVVEKARRVLNREPSPTFFLYADIEKVVSLPEFADAFSLPLDEKLYQRLEIVFDRGRPVTFSYTDPVFTTSNAMTFFKDLYQINLQSRA